MKYQSTATGEIFEGEDPPHPSIEMREKLLASALSSWGWSAEVGRMPANGNERPVAFSAKIRNSAKTYDLEIFIFPNLASSSRNRPLEKRIQITRNYDKHRTSFERDLTGDARCLLLGLYCLGDDEVVICAWDASGYRSHANPTSCYVHLQAIADAFRFGFARSRDKKNRCVCCFRPEFFHYYLENMAALHSAELSDTATHPETDTHSPELHIESFSGDNLIFYGAPGTGKTHRVNQLANSNICVRTVFHPDMQNSDFVGALKPVMKGDLVTYAFSPGPFAIALRSAFANPEQKIFLVIEELNRAPAAAVFGDLFLLLDRDLHGAGKYDVEFPTPEFKAWIEDSLGCEVDRMVLPRNLWLLATMNSADQGVYPIDTAFRRRWRQYYIPIDYSNAPSGSLDVVFPNDSIISIPWSTFAKTVNSHLLEQLDIAEDRLLGPWFVTTHDLADTSTIPEKVLIYLWDDLLRHHGREKVFDTDSIKSFGEISKFNSSHKRIFSDLLLSKFDHAALLG